MSPKPRVKRQKRKEDRKKQKRREKKVDRAWWAEIVEDNGALVPKEESVYNLRMTSDQNVIQPLIWIYNRHNNRLKNPCI